MSNPIDVWLKFDHDGHECVDTGSTYQECDYCENASHEANTYQNNDGTYRIEWYLAAVGLVTTETFATLDEAHAWYERNGFIDYTT